MRASIQRRWRSQRTSPPTLRLADSRVAVLCKTSWGAKWLFPFVEALHLNTAEVVVFLPDEDGDLAERLRSAGFDVVLCRALGRPSARGLWSLLELRNQLAKFDVVNYFLYRSALVGRLSTLGLSIKRVHSVPGPLFYESRVVRVFERHLSKLDDRLFAGSIAVGAAARSAGVDPDCVRVVRFGADMNKFRPSVKNQDSDAKRPRFVMVAYWYGKKRLALGGADLKGHDCVLEAWAKYRRAGGTGSLHLVGSGVGSAGEEYRRTMLLQHCAADDDSILLSETVSDVRPFYSASDVSVSPSRSENYGAVAEAAGMGLPTIASRSGGLPEVVVTGVSGWLFDAGDSDQLCEALLEAEHAVASGHAAQMGAEARLRVSALLAWPTIVESYLAELEQVIDPA